MTNEHALNEPAESHGNDAKPKFNIAVAYDSYGAARRALRIFSSLLDAFGDEFDFQCQLWRFDVLALLDVRQAAVRSSTSADMLVVSAEADGEMPAFLKQWLEDSIEGKAPGTAALVGLLEARGQTASEMYSPTRRFLQDAAHRAGLDFFLHEVHFNDTEIESVNETRRTGAVSFITEDIFHKNESLRRATA